MNIIYKTDNWHTHASSTIIGIAINSTPEAIINEWLGNNDYPNLTDDDIRELYMYKQTQNYSGGQIEFLIEEVEQDIAF